jgi:DivIVA domain-containing protein
MPLTPADIHNMNFRKSSRGRRGYDMEEVDVLLDSVSHEMIGLLEQNDVLRDEARRADAAVARQTTAGNTAEAQLAAVNGELSRLRRTCDRAERKAQDLQNRLAEARRAAGGQIPAGSAAGGADRVLAVAQHTAELHIESAHAEALGLVRDARADSERIAEKARQAARDLAEQSRRRDQDAAADLEIKQIAVHKEIVGLADLAAQYRAALEDHIRRRLQT